MTNPLLLAHINMPIDLKYVTKRRETGLCLTSYFEADEE